MKRSTSFKLALRSFLAGLILVLGIHSVRPNVIEQTEDWLIPEAKSDVPAQGFAELTKRVKPLVVNISTTKEVASSQSPFGRLDPFFGPFGSPYPQRKEKNHSLGTGFIIDGEGHIITNNHVVEGADEIIVTLDNKKEIQAKIVGRDPRLDIAVLKLLKPGDYPRATLGNSDNLEVGDWVVAIGNPFGLGHTVTAGIVSAKARYLGAGPYDDFIQTDASINPGNSGGPLFNTHGEVIGINTAIIATGQGLGFAIPINMAKEIIPQLIEKGKVVRGWLGVAIGDLSPEETTKQGLADKQGAYVAEVVPGGPADRAGIKTGDFITHFNGQEVENSHELPTLVGRLAPGVEATVNFIQQGKNYERRVLLGSIDDPQASIDPSALQAEQNLLGMALRNLTPMEQKQVGQGIIVTQVKRGSAAASVGIQQGDLIVELNGRNIRDVATFKQYLMQVRSGEVVRLGLARGSYMYYFAFRKD